MEQVRDQIPSFNSTAGPDLVLVSGTKYLSIPFHETFSKLWDF